MRCGLQRCRGCREDRGRRSNRAAREERKRWDARPRVEPTPARIAELSAWLVTQNALLTEFRAGRRSLEQAFLTITEASPSP